MDTGAQTQMSEHDDYDDNDDTEESANNLVKRLRSEIKERDKKLKDREAELTEARTASRDLAFIKAGVPLDSAQGRVFAKAYDGELSPEAIKSSEDYQELFPAPPKADVNTEAAHDRMDAAASGADAPSPDSGYEDEMAKAQSEEEVMAIMQRHNRPTTHNSFDPPVHAPS